MTVAMPDPPCPDCGKGLLDCPYPENQCPLLNETIATQTRMAIRNEAIRKVLQEGALVEDLAGLYGVQPRTIYRVVKGRTEHG